jgi:hypothetical protein
MWLRVLAVVHLLLCPAVAYAAVPQAFLVQNSGWMEAFYGDPGSAFRKVVEAVITAVTEPGEAVTVLAFNQAVPGNDSPRRLFAGPPGPRLGAALAQLEVARKPSGALADTDFKEAVTKTVLGTLGARPGIIWIFTNNKNSPGNDPETAQRNREFYALLHDEPSIVRTVVFPLSMPVNGKYPAKGLMVYGLAYGPDADARLVQLVSGPIRTVLNEPPARLKPLHQDSVGLIPGTVKNDPSIRVSRTSDGWIVLDVDVSRRQPVAEITARVENRFYPYVIRRAVLSARITGRGWADDLTVTPAGLTDLEPGASREVAVRLPIPLAAIPSVWSPKVLSSLGTQIKLPGSIDIALADQQLEVARAFQDRLGVIFPGDPLPEIFTPSKSVRASRVSIPVLIRVSYPVYPLIVLGTATLALVGLVVGLLMTLGGEKRFAIVVDGDLRRVAVKPFGRAEIRSATGEVVGTIKRGVGRPSVSQTAPGHSISVRT